MNSAATQQPVPGKAANKYDLPALFFIPTLHILAIVAIPYFSWDALAICLFGLFIVTPFGVNLAYHRVLSHRSLKLPKWLEYTFVTVGAAMAGGPPLFWAAAHRAHHKYSDTEKDPHNSRRGFWYSHMTHLFQGRSQEEIDSWLKLVPDLRDDRYYRFLNAAWIPLSALVLIPLYLAGGVGYVLWGGVVRIVLMLHFTWFVNSLCHLWGYRNYNSADRATNNWLVAILAAGEGWHNNHHAHQYSATNRHRWWEFDFTYSIIWTLEKLGLATHVRRPRFMTTSESADEMGADLTPATSEA